MGDDGFGEERRCRTMRQCGVEDAKEVKELRQAIPKKTIRKNELEENEKVRTKDYERGVGNNAGQEGQS